jgi:hypothetical protein
MDMASAPSCELRAAEIFTWQGSLTSLQSGPVMIIIIHIIRKKKRKERKIY